jgi:hypothetical protein
VELTDLERELLELCCLDAEGGEPTRALQVEMLDAPIERGDLEAVLTNLVRRGLMRRWRGTYLGVERPRAGGEQRTVDYVDDWWVVTDRGRAAIGVPPAAETGETFWMNPSSGPWRVPPVLAPWCGWRFRRGKAPLPAWLARGLRKDLLGQEDHWRGGPRRVRR